MQHANNNSEKDLQTAVLAGGCFWCVEAIFKRLRGVENVTSGYAGKGDRPTYEQVSTGTTGFTEALEIKFDPKVIPFPTLLDVFWAVHDPTTLNRQGADIGPQYRSAIFYLNEEQKKQAQESIINLEKSGKYQDKIVTSVEPLQDFYPAEEYHRDFYDQNRTYGYCRLVIDPKVQKLYKSYSNLLKSEI